jgi:hypothetical protein
MLRRAFLIALAILLSSTASVMSGASTGFNGYVRTTGGWPVAGAEVIVGRETMVSAYATTADVSGYYSVDVPLANDYTVLVNVPGYESQDRTMLSPSTQDFALTALASGFLVETINQGWKCYQCPQWQTCYRTDGEVEESPSLFPDIEANSSAIAALMAAIGAGTSPSQDDAQIWSKAQTLWNWLKLHANFNYEDPLWQQASDFMMAQDWPSIDRIAQTYLAYGFLPWGSCMSRAQMFTTLLFRTGVPKERLAIAETRWQLRYSQHMYTILYIAGRWIHLDPSFNEGHDFPDWDEFCSIPRAGNQWTDYLHPLKLTTIPGSGLTVVPEVTRRSAGTRHILLTAPPDGGQVVAPDVLVTGNSDSVAHILLNGAEVAMVFDTFAFMLPLNVGANTIAARLTIGSTVYSDAVSIARVVALTPPPTSTPTATATVTATPPATATLVRERLYLPLLLRTET